MANERRLIDANALKACVKKRLLNGAIIRWIFSIINTCPTVDAVEVVRCKDCSWRDVEDDCMNPKCGKSWYGCPVSDEHYCSYGERKGGQAPQREDV